MVCARCARPAPAAAAYCGNCGARLREPAPARSLLERLSARIGSLTGVAALDGLRVRDLFSSVVERHTDVEIEDVLIAGAPSTTPPLADVRAVWPKPWMFVRVFVLLLVAGGLLEVALLRFGNPLAIPGLLTIGAFAVPLTIVLFYFEMNVTRNVSLYAVFRMVVAGGALAILIGLVEFDFSHIQDVFGDPAAGVVEEIAKVAALVLVVRNPRYPWTLNGLLLGGAVGAGFAGFETAGYAFRALLVDTGAMNSTLVMRAVLAPGGHVAWAALSGAALWKVKGTRPFAFDLFGEWPFLRVLLLTMALHAAWDLDTPGPLILPKYALLTIVAVVAVLGFVQAGIKEVQHAKLGAAAA